MGGKGVEKEKTRQNQLLDNTANKSKKIALALNASILEKKKAEAHRKSTAQIDNTFLCFFAGASRRSRPQHRKVAIFVSTQAIKHTRVLRRFS